MNPAEQILDRDTYRKLKGYNRNQMVDFCNRLYMNGKNSAFRELDLERLRSDIGAIKGIGEVKLNEIMMIILNAFNIDDSEPKGGEK